MEQSNKARKLLSIIEEQDKHIQSKWDTMTEEEQAEYTKKKQETEKTFNEYAENLNAKFKDPMRMLVRKGNKSKFGKNIFKRLNTKR
jgi:hypothetical protein